MQPFQNFEGVVAPLLEDDVNTDQVTPVSQAPSLTEDYGALLFRNRRWRKDGSRDTEFVLNRPEYRHPGILAVGRNFGCGSSREMAVWAMLAFGIKCIVARSFADYYRENCLQNGLLPVTLDEPAATSFEDLVLATAGSAPFSVDLIEQRIGGPNGQEFPFTLPEADRIRLLEGLDDIGLSLKCAADISRWEQATAAAQPWLQSAKL